jgi:signal transduction histidine kinase
MEYDIEVIRHSNRSLKIYLNIVKSAKNEIYFIFPTSRAFIRQLKAIDLASQAAKERNVKVKILTPCNETVEKSIKHFLKKGQSKEEKQNQGISKSSIDSFSDNNIEVRFIEKMANTKATILVADRKDSLVMELKDDTRDTFIEAIGLSIHSTSKASALSYVAIFENLWKQSELYEEIKKSNENLKMANEKLKVKDKVLNEFIHIASHELRNPIQPILSLSQIVKSIFEQKSESEIDKDKIFNILDIIIRNAKKLHRISNDVLDAAKIETNSFVLTKEKFNLIEWLKSLIDDFKSQQQNDICDIKMDFNIEKKQQQQQNENYFIIEADKARISQVISNLLLNALKFTNKDCLIQVIVEKKELDRRKKEIIVSIKDTGTGIDHDIFPKLFTKFATKSSQGTGLGLYICKNIVEAHGGKIWAKNNNEDGKGAIFSFSLPFSISN